VGLTCSNLSIGTATACTAVIVQVTVADRGAAQHLGEVELHRVVGRARGGAAISSHALGTGEALLVDSHTIVASGALSLHAARGIDRQVGLDALAATVDAAVVTGAIGAAKQVRINAFATDCTIRWAVPDADACCLQVARVSDVLCGRTHWVVWQRLIVLCDGACTQTNQKHAYKVSDVCCGVCDHRRNTVTHIAHVQRGLD
jgi:hypothetical protein